LHNNEPSDQRQTFLAGEANAYHQRNHETTRELSHGRRQLIGWCEPLADRITDVLEIGSGSGDQLKFLCDAIGAKGYGVDPSEQATNEWKNRSDVATNISLSVGTSDSLDFPDDSFDLVVLGFFLYLVDRNLLFKTIAEVDRVLKNGGFVAIQDFDSSKPYYNQYLHNDGIKSYKNDYTGIFTASHHYHLVHKMNLSPTDASFNTDADKRIAISLLYKQELDIYEMRP
jgi:ubiquinone/menaquinone biosynthesis C-methylase UbiE